MEQRCNPDTAFASWMTPGKLLDLSELQFLNVIHKDKTF